MKVLLSILSLLLLHSFAYSNTTSDNTNSSINSLNFRFAEAMEAEDIATLKLLIESVDVDSHEIVRLLGKTPLHHAVSIEDVDITRLLIDAGADVHALSASERTPIYWTAFNGNETIARMLLEADANPNPVDYYDRTPASWANQSEHYEIADILNNAANK